MRLQGHGDPLTRWPAVWLTALLVASGCEGETGCTGGDEIDLPPIFADAGDAGPADAAQGGTPFRVRRATLDVESIDMDAPIPARRGKVLASGSLLTIRAITQQPLRLFVAHHGHQGAQSNDIDVIDGSGNVVTKGLRGFNRVNENAGVASVRTTSSPSEALLRLESGRVTIPRPRGPDGESLSHWIIVMAEESPEVLLFARGPGPTDYFGRWTNYDEEDVVLDQECPLHPERFTWDPIEHAFDVQNGWGSPGPRGAGDEECVRARVHPLRGATCRSWGHQHADRPDDFEQAWLTGGWVTESSSGYTMALDTETGERQWLAPPQCPARLVAALASPPRVLTGCVGPGTKRTYSIWRPGASVLFDIELEREQGFTGLGTLSNPVVPATSLDWERDDTMEWIDIQGGAVIETPPLQPLRAGSQPQVSFVSRRQGDRIELLRLDTVEPSLRRLATYDDCDGELRFLDHRGARVAIACARRRGERYVYDLRWSEVLDLESHRRWRTDAMIEALTPQGVVASDRRVDALEDESTSSSIFLLDLAGDGD